MKCIVVVLLFFFALLYGTPVACPWSLLKWRALHQTGDNHTNMGQRH